MSSKVAMVRLGSAIVGGAMGLGLIAAFAAAAAMTMMHG